MSNATITLHNGTTIEATAYTAKAFREDTYKAYILYVKAVETPSKKAEVSAFNAFKAIAENFCVFDVDYYADFVHGVEPYMEAFAGLSGDTPAHKVKSISAYRALFKKGVLMQIRAAAVQATMPKAPASLNKKPAKKAVKKVSTAKVEKAVSMLNDADRAAAIAFLQKIGVYAK